jgi:hypothetical protein
MRKKPKLGVTCPTKVLIFLRQISNLLSSCLVPEDEEIEDSELTQEHDQKERKGLKKQIFFC